MFYITAKKTKNNIQLVTWQWRHLIQWLLYFRRTEDRAQSLYVHVIPVYSLKIFGPIARIDNYKLFKRIFLWSSRIYAKFAR